MRDPLSRISQSEHHFLFPHLPVPLPGIISSTGSSIATTQRYNWNGLRRGKIKFVVFQWTIAGRGLLKFEGKDYDILPHQAMVLQIPHRHCYCLPKDSASWQFIYVTFHGPALFQLVGDLIRKCGPLWTLLPESPAVQTAVKIYESVARGELVTPFAACALTNELAMHLADQAFPSPRHNSRFASLRVYIETHLNQDLNVGTLAGIAGLSRFHFSRMFTASESISPRDFLLHARVKAAARLFSDRRLSLKEISARTGFHSPHYMTEVFKRFFGCSARDLRKRGNT
jgi:AraC-like DNA-binding protein